MTPVRLAASMTALCCEKRWPISLEEISSTLSAPANALSSVEGCE
ncbi:hypothetical protein KPSA1_04303 [Pseudomonas syringae pv. actinidiae]|uniref:Uncharacterized protein n=1 Tax=Pseudomonas syringae pv. actinidiae TaxID=103796 RepID=A0A2V0QCP3_PSESF|nr:hypothetical protein KPSA1_04303 [Pseudomonas syringae pv. actinidiae]